VPLKVPTTDGASGHGQDAFLPCHNALRRSSGRAVSRRGVIRAAALAPLAGASGAWGAAASAGREGFATVPGGRLWHWDTGGADDALIFVHPATGSDQSWLNQRDFFADRGYRVIAYARWGYGKSDPAPTDDRKEYQDLLALIDALAIERAHVVGVAAGAGVVAPFVAGFPERVRTATLIGSVTGISDPQVQAISSRLRPVNFHDLPPEFRELSPSYRAADPAGVRAWLAIERDRVPSGRDRRAQTTLAALGAGGIPVLFATGDADLFAPPYLMRLVASAVPGAAYRTIAEAGHAAFWEQPDAFNQLVLGHLRRSE